jgi:hypothetical protein
LIPHEIRQRLAVLPVRNFTSQAVPDAHQLQDPTVGDGFLKIFRLFARTDRRMLRASDKPPGSCVGEGVVKLIQIFKEQGVFCFTVGRS